MNLKIIITDPELEAFGLPERATVGSAGIDLRAMTQSARTILQPGAVMPIETGIRIWIEDPGFVGLVYPRSGLGTKGLVLANGTGVIDSDYQGSVKCFMWNRGTAAIQINRGDRIAQLVVVPVAQVVPVFVNSFESETERGEDGFGSTGAS